MAAGGAAVLLAVGMLLLASSGGPQIGFQSGRLWAQADRGPVESSSQVVGENASRTLEHVAYQSGGATVYALLRLPVRDSLSPAFIVLPARTVPKDAPQEMALSEMLVGMGYAALTLDQRNQGAGVGETGGPEVSLAADYDTLASGGTPVQALRVLDILRAVDLLAQDPRINPSRIYVLGESMGGQYALLAASLEPRVKGVVLFSGAGFLGDYSGQPSGLRDFLSALDPENYLASIAGRPLAFVHATADAIVPIDLALERYDRSPQPKQFWEVNGSVHALYDSTVDASLRQAVAFAAG